MKKMKIFGASLLFMMFFLLTGCVEQVTETKEKTEEELFFIRARKAMVENHIKARGITDERLLEAMGRVERHRFVREDKAKFAYRDHPLPIAEGQTISQPFIVAIMTELLQLDGDETVLEIGTGSGYHAAILAELAEKVYTIEILEPLAIESARLLEELGYENITVKFGDGYLGWEEHAPFDAIVVTAAPPHIPQPLIDQLAEGGRMVIPVGVEWQDLKLIERTDGEIITTSIIPVRFVPFTGDEVEKKR